MSQYSIKKMLRCPGAKHGFVIEFTAHDMFAVMDDLRSRLGSVQYSKVSGGLERPWYFVFVREATSPGYGSSDGHLSLRLYVNDDDISIPLYLICGKNGSSIITL